MARDLLRGLGIKLIRTMTIIQVFTIVKSVRRRRKQVLFSKMEIMLLVLMMKCSFKNSWTWDVLPSVWPSIRRGSL